MSALGPRTLVSLGGAVVAFFLVPSIVVLGVRWTGFVAGVEIDQPLLGVAMFLGVMGGGIAVPFVFIAIDEVLS
jgi:hypothetical protein